MANESPTRILEYEVWMLRRTQEHLEAWDAEADPARRFKAQSDANRVIYIAVLESFLVHARGLFEFFYDRRSPNPRHRDDIRPDQVLKPGVVWPRTGNEPPQVKAWRFDINKRLQHLTTSRTALPFQWTERDIRKHLDGLVDELNALGPADGPIIGQQHPGA